MCKLQKMMIINHHNAESTDQAFSKYELIKILVKNLNIKQIRMFSIY
ncbi:hypothetical protein CLAUR_042190 [Clostridium felsineum]|nr:hypothetical protein CLAUR_042190 [Clostridium felsineum]